MLYLLRMFEVFPEVSVHSLGGLLWVAGHGFDVDFQTPLQKLVHLSVIIVIIPGNGSETNIFKAQTSKPGSYHFPVWCPSIAWDYHCNSACLLAILARPVIGVAFLNI